MINSIETGLKNVVIGTVGTILDKRGNKHNRWRSWRPSLGACLQTNLPIHRFELLYQENHKHIALQLQQDITIAAPQTEVYLHCVPISDPWDFQETYTQLYEFSKLYQFDREKENYYVHITTGTHVMQICWFLLTEAHYFPAKLLQTSPPKKERESQKQTSVEKNIEQDEAHIDIKYKENEHSIDIKPVAGTYSIIDLDLSRYDEIAKRHASEKDNHYEQLKSGIATLNSNYNHMITEIEKVATLSKSPILLNGPTGSGKSFLAKRIYDLKRSKHQLVGDFVEVNCATLRGDAAMSALFGHTKGAYTGALSDRPGLLKRANGGLLFLDEIGELGLDEQAMLLKAIEEKVFYPLGSDKEISSDFQLIAGTHRDLRQWVRAGKFREDLYARINLWAYELPSLANRPEDIAPNITYELNQFAFLNQQQVAFSTEAKQKYLSFATSKHAKWSGNFRELSASITRLATLSSGGRIDASLVDEEIKRLEYAWGLKLKDSDRLETVPIEKELEFSDLIDLNGLDLFDKQQLLTVLEVCKSSKNLSEAGRKLFSVSRTEKKSPNDADRLRKYLAKFGLSWELIHSY
ncbi:RNA repair transcriptional activator RtcR [Thorsellia anophelis]|uniref:Transcriptional regulatory protein RtcR n=1 Tax=Thorsellia anophelis DSM 18579 TaxID=1123402 RepID=A0A1H9YSC8_9GAMM|nr:RNA repair transcriptional activator RtcR [Thorsellia anophelis]SES72051.1 transcriptional regulatory protein RtcR [Thorsellia anophelis DSM 18579]